MLENVDIEVAGVLYVSFAWMDIPEIERDNSRRPVCFVYRKAATVRLRAIKGRFRIFLLQFSYQRCYIEGSVESRNR